MHHIFVIFGGVFMVIFMAISCTDPIDNKGDLKVRRHDCYMIPEVQRDHVADLVVQCVNNATAKNTGENQDADDWVEACKDEITSIYKVTGYREYTGPAGNPEYLTGCKEFPRDSSLTNQ